MENITSEQELKQLLDEGKITNNEYEQLFNAMKARSVEGEVTSNIIDKVKSKSTHGKIAFLLMLVGIVLPFTLYRIADKFARSHDPNMRAGMTNFFFLGIALEITALTLGIISWRNDYGKAATIISGIILFLVVIFIIINAF